MPRHGASHSIPPHKIPYKANLSALHSIGVRHVVATCVAGSLRKEIEPGHFVVPDQFINFTWGRDDVFDKDGEIVHLPMADPYCDTIRALISRSLADLGATYAEKGTVVVIQGPRFSTVAESKMLALWGGDIVNMTNYPECYFARELGLCYGVVASVTDYDVGVPSTLSMRPESMQDVLRVFHKNTASTLRLIEKIASCAGDMAACACSAGRLIEYYKLAKS